MAKKKDVNGDFFKVYRTMWDNPIITKDKDYFYMWMYLLKEAAWKEHDTVWGGQRVTLKPGQFITGRKKLAIATDTSEAKVYRILKAFEDEQQIEQRTNNYGTLISIVNWNLYQGNEQQTKQRTNNERTTSEQRVNTTEEKGRIGKNREEGEEDIYIDAEPIDPNFKHTYGSFGHVTLTDIEKEKLIEKYGVEDTEEAIEFLDAYMQGGKRYKSCYQAIYTWVIDAVRKRRTPQGQQYKPKNNGQRSFREVIAEQMEKEGNGWR